MFEYILLFFAILIILIALNYFSKFMFNKNTKKNIKKSQNTISFVNCPLCNTPLLKGENLVSKVYRPMNVNDQLCTIYGCPHCYPKCKPNITRTCPVCHKTVGQENYLISRLFNKTKSGKKHIIINGCGNCNGHKNL